MIKLRRHATGTSQLGIPPSAIGSSLFVNSPRVLLHSITNVFIKSCFTVLLNIVGIIVAKVEPKKEEDPGKRYKLCNSL